MNPSHAYIHGSIYKEQHPSAMTFLFKRILHWIESQQACLVWAQFRENSVMGRDSVYAKFERYLECVSKKVKSRKRTSETMVGGQEPFRFQRS